MMSRFSIFDRTMESHRPAARSIWFALTGFFAIAGVVLAVVGSVIEDPHRVGSALGAGVNALAFWTIQSNLICGAVAIRMSWNRAPLSTGWTSLLLLALTMISTTGIIFNLFLGDESQPGLMWHSSLLCHIVVPMLMVVGWAVFSPRAPMRLDMIVLVVTYATGWAAFTLARGAWTGFYPYFFVNAGQLGYAVTLLNLAGLALLLGMIAGVFLWIEHWLSRRAA